MKKLSRWSKHHQWSARIILGISFILLIVLGFITGQLLRDSNVRLSPVILVCPAILYIAAYVFYPRAENRVSISLFYWKQKTCDMLLAASTYLLVTSVGNNPHKFFNYSSPFAAAKATISVSGPKDSAIKTYKSIRVFAESMRDKNGKMLKWKERKKMLKEQVRAIKNSREPSTGGQALLIILSVLLAMGLIAGVGALACSISCNGGSGAASWIVAIGGTALVVFLLVVIIRKIMGKKKRRSKVPETEPPGQ